MDGLTEAQQARVDELGATLDDRGKAGLRALATLREMESSWRADRYATIYAATQALDSGLLHLDQVLAALDVSRTTWFRRRAELRAILAGRPQAVASAIADQVTAAARHLDEADTEESL